MGTHFLSNRHRGGRRRHRERATRHFGANRLRGNSTGHRPDGLPALRRYSFRRLALSYGECQSSLLASHRRLRPMKLKPLGDRLIVQAVEEATTTASGIVLPDTAKEKPQKGKVIAVGDGRLSEETGKRIPLDVSEGDEVLYSKYGGAEITVDGEDLLVLRESDVLARVTG